MKKRITIDELAMCFASAVAYGIGYTVLERLGLHEILCFALSFVPGLLAEELLELIIFSKFIQEKTHRRIISWLMCVVVFILGSILSIAIFQQDLGEDLVEEFLWAFGIPLVSFILSFIVYNIKKIILLHRYGNGSKGYKFTRGQKAYMYSLNEQNKKIEGKFKEKTAVKTETGIYVGKKKGKILSFLGIPYAKAPVCELRWKKPVPLEPSDGVFEAIHYGPSAIQPYNKANPVTYHRQSEDCLYLNIWAPKDKKEKKPVMVYLHDGDYLSGGSADPVGEGETFVKNHPDTIFVSFNYRLGLFGFIDFSLVPGGEDYHDSPNLGLLDQIEALKWINKNIASFGGDSNNVTLVGAGSGAISAILLSSIKEARNYFKKVITMSMTTEYVHDDPTSSSSLGKAVLEEMKVNSMEELLQVPAEKLKAAISVTDNLGGAPSFSAYPLSAHLLETPKTKKPFGDIQFMIGLPKSEISNMVALVGKKAAKENIISWFDEIENDPEWKPYLEKFEIRKPKSNRGIGKFYEKLNSFAFIDLPLYLGRIMSECGNDVRFFYWEITPTIEKFEANSTSFVTTLFNNFDVGHAFGYINDKNLRKVLQLYVTKFLKNEEIRLYLNEIIGIDETPWPLYKESEPSVMCFSQKKLKVDHSFGKK